jgi:hypothetical protein
MPTLILNIPVVLQEPVDFVTEVKRTNEVISEPCLNYEVQISEACKSAIVFWKCRAKCGTSKKLLDVI